MIAQKEEWVQVDNVTSFTEFIPLSLQLLEKYFVLFFLSFCIINDRSKECQIFRQQLHSRTV